MSVLAWSEPRDALRIIGPGISTTIEDQRQSEFASGGIMDFAGRHPIRTWFFRPRCYDLPGP